MKCIIAGSRTITDYLKVANAVVSSGMALDITEVVSGTAQGVDKLGEIWAIKNNVQIKKFPANWQEYGKSAGMIRNRKMAEYADALIAIWDGKSKGTLNMIIEAKSRGLKVYVHRI